MDSEDTNGPLALTPTEKMLLELLVEKERRLMGELQQQASGFYRQLEQRLEMESGAIGTTHRVDPATSTVVELEENGGPSEVQ